MCANIRTWILTYKHTHIVPLSRRYHEKTDEAAMREGPVSSQGHGKFIMDLPQQHNTNIVCLYVVLCVLPRPRKVSIQLSTSFVGLPYFSLKRFSCLVSHQGGPVCWSVGHWLHSSAEVIRIWDSLFADEKRFDYLVYTSAVPC